MSSNRKNSNKDSIFNILEALPLIEFQLEEDISDEEAINLLQNTNEWQKKSQEDVSEHFQTLLIDDSSQNTADLFTDTLINLEVSV